MSKSTFRSVHPVLPSQHVPRAIEFYTNRLGFRLAFKDSEENPHYAGVVRDNVELHLQWHDPSEWSAVERPMLRFLVANIEDLFEEYKTQGVFHSNTQLRDTAWGTQEFAFYDKDKNGLTFYRDR